MMHLELLLGIKLLKAKQQRAAWKIKGEKNKTPDVLVSPDCYYRTKDPDREKKYTGICNWLRRYLLHMLGLNKGKLNEVRRYQNKICNCLALNY